MLYLTELYNELKYPRGFNNGRSIPAGLYEARNILINIINDGLKDAEYSNVEAYPVDKVRDHIHLSDAGNIYRIGLRFKDSKTPAWVSNMVYRILDKAQKDWEIHTTISLVRRD